MAALSTGNFIRITRHIHQELKKYNCCPTTLSCQIRESAAEDKPVAETKRDNQKKKKELSQVFVSGLDKIGKGLKDYKSPQKKGDWKDLVLMSLSFAVYVYISQKIVCAYCAWMPMLNQPW